MGGAPNRTTSVQDIPTEFKPAFTSLFNSAFGAARTAGGQPGFPQNFWGQPAPSPASPVNQQIAAPQVQMPQGFQSFGGGNFRGFGGGGGQPGFGGGGGGGTPTYPFPTPQAPTNPAQGSTNPGGTSVPLTSGPPIIGQAFPGPFTAPNMPIELESLAAREAAGRQLGGIGDPLLGLGQFTAQGGFLNAGANPYLQGALQAAINPAAQTFTRSVLPGFESQALQSGAFKGSSARDMALGNLANDFGRNILDTTSQIAFQNFVNERALQQQSGQLLQQGAQLQQLSPEILAQVGSGQRELAQRAIDEQLLRFQEQQQAPFRPLGPLASIIQGTQIGNTQTIQGPRPSPIAGGIAGAAGLGTTGALLGNQIFGNAAGSAAGGGLGALLGGLAGGLA